MQSTQTVANRLVALCHEGRMIDAQTELMAADCEQIEPDNVPTPSAKGLVAILEKEHRFQAAVEAIHNIDISDPLVAGNHFCIRLCFDLTLRGKGRLVLHELGLYEVRAGKIVRETFFY